MYRDLNGCVVQLELHSFQSAIFMAKHVTHFVRMGIHLLLFNLFSLLRNPSCIRFGYRQVQSVIGSVSSSGRIAIYRENSHTDIAPL
jgi:hypothetical protein